MSKKTNRLLKDDFEKSYQTGVDFKSIMDKDDYTEESLNYYRKEFLKSKRLAFKILTTSIVIVLLLGSVFVMSNHELNKKGNGLINSPGGIVDATLTDQEYKQILDMANNGTIKKVISVCPFDGINVNIYSSMSDNCKNYFYLVDFKEKPKFSLDIILNNETIVGIIYRRIGVLTKIPVENNEQEVTLELTLILGKETKNYTIID